MKCKLTIILAAALFVALLLSSTALAATVRITGDCNVRRGPGLGYDIIDVAYQGDELEYWEETVTDERGVDWYNVIYGNLSAWVSSKYATLNSSSGNTGSSGKTGSSPSASSAQGGLIELSGYYGRSIEAAAKAAGGGFYVEQGDGEDGVYVSYEKLGLYMHGDADDNVLDIYINAESRYSLLGITVGMSRSDAQAILKQYTMRASIGDESAEYIIEGTKYDWRTMLYIAYSGGRVAEINYGSWS